MTLARPKMVTTHLDLETTETLVGLDERSFLPTHAVATTYPPPSKRRAKVAVFGPVILPNGDVLDDQAGRELGGTSGYYPPMWLVRCLADVGVIL